mmetsp:Transcript_9422/g.12817  ORF Transcript_9422/g.12817 Transcript_9422/m.12817 type:complete len:234 (-) Transcript_9422:546-1247(-)
MKDKAARRLRIRRINDRVDLEGDLLLAHVSIDAHHLAVEAALIRVVVQIKADVVLATEVVLVYFHSRRQSYRQVTISLVNRRQDQRDCHVGDLADGLLTKVKVLHRQIRRLRHLHHKPTFCSVNFILLRGKCRHDEAIRGLHRIWISHFVDLESNLSTSRDPRVGDLEPNAGLPDCLVWRVPGAICHAQPARPLARWHLKLAQGEPNLDQAALGDWVRNGEAESELCHCGHTR